MLSALEAADQKQVVNLRGVGLRNGSLLRVELRNDGLYHNEGSLALGSSDLIAEAQVGSLLLTLTAELRSEVGDLGEFPQPLLAPSGSSPNTGDPPLPVVSTGTPATIRLVGIDVRQGPNLFVDGQTAAGSVACVGGTFALACTSEVVDVTLDAGLASGLHRLQLQNPLGLLSNEMPVCGGNASQCD